MPTDIARLVSAASFAAHKHTQQRRKDVAETPYINHPIQVAEVLIECGVEDVDVLIAAILHDTVEDTETSFDEIAERFGERVSVLVGEVTDDKSLPKAERKRLQIETAPKKSDRGKQLKLADKICNVRDLSEESPAGWDTQRKLEYLTWAEKVCAGCQGVNAKLDEQIQASIQTARSKLSSHN